MPAAPLHARRHHGMDWLRIGAFALLILYHVGMVFAPWGWVVKSRTTYPALIVPMALLTPWRLALLFAVSGYASRMLFGKARRAGAFIRARSGRLLVPLAFGMVALVPIEMWVRVRAHGYGGSYPGFWLHDYWRTGMFDGVAFPSWEHLWFVAYLWTYSCILAAAVGLGARADRLADWVSSGFRLLWVPIAMLATTKLALLFVVPERQGLFTDWSGHVEYGAMFAAGFVLAGHPRLWRRLAHIALPAATIALVAGIVVAIVEVHWPGEAIPPHAVMAADRVARMAMAWSMTCLLFHLADRWLDRDHAARATLSRAVFPAYLLHHPALVLAAWYTLPLDLAAPAEFALLSSLTILACGAGYAIGARIDWIGTLIGMPRRVSPERPSR